MGGEMNFEHKDDRPIGSQMPLYRSILDEIKKATAHLKPLDLSSSDLEGVDLGYYELCLDLGMPYFILFPKDPDTHKVLSWMHARKMSYSSKSLMHPLLKKLSRTFPCFLLDYGDGYDGYGMEYESYNDSRDSYEDGYGMEYGSYNDNDWSPDFTACSSDDCGMCGNCDY
ncbi:hypothetical protein BGX30_007325 [Mortierella sp. GBA39]|nr:hypothetical protein BGX30_007325 [Mortierella sp. GBA39]